MQTENHNTKPVYSIVLSAEPNWQYSRQWSLTAGYVINVGKENYVLIKNLKVL